MSAVAGENATNPRTSRKKSALPTVATGTPSETTTVAEPPPGTVTLAGLTEMERDDPPVLTVETLKVAEALPKFRSWTSRASVKSWSICALPKLTAGSSSDEAITAVRVAGYGCTRPAPPRRAVYPATCDGSAVLTIATRTFFASQSACPCKPTPAPPPPHAP